MPPGGDCSVHEGMIHDCTGQDHNSTTLADALVPVV